MALTCPTCGGEATTVKVAYECLNKHVWGEDVDRTPSPVKNRARMPFGKHKGEFIDDLPLDYINWCLDNIDNLSPSLKEEMTNQKTLKAGGGVVRRDVKITGKKVRF